MNIRDVYNMYCLLSIYVYICHYISIVIIYLLSLYVYCHYYFLIKTRPNSRLSRCRAVAHLCSLDKDMGSGRHGAGIRSTSLDQRDTMSDVVILKDVVSDCLLKDALNYFKSIQCHEYAVNMILICH